MELPHGRKDEHEGQEVRGSRYDNFGGKVGIGAEEYLSRINIKVYEGDENGNLVFEGGAAECLAWADGYCGDC